MSDEFNAEELVTPEWLNSDFFCAAINNYYKSDDVDVRGLRMEPASLKGDHFASVMYRALVIYLRNEIHQYTSFIVKTMPKTQSEKLKMLGDSRIFETEIGMYTKVLPKFDEILKEIDDQTNLSPACIYTSLSPNKVIVLEDLKALGFRVLRDRYCTIDESKVILTKLAKWHAISHTFCNEDNSFLNGFNAGLLSLPGIENNVFIAGGIRQFTKLLESLTHLKQYAKYFHCLKNSMLSRLDDSFTEYGRYGSVHDFYVLCHGDFNAKNMMFEMNANTNQIQDVVFIDFQLSYVGSIAMDLIHAMFMVFDLETHAEHLDEMLLVYLEQFKTTSLKIGVDAKGIPELNDLKDIIKRHRLWAIFLMSTFLPMWISSFQDNKLDADDLGKYEDHIYNLYHNEEYIKQLEVLLPKYKEMGMFEDLGQ